MSACVPRCDLGDISTVTPVTLHRRGHCPPCTTQGTEVSLMCECNAHTNGRGGGGGFSLTYSLLFENTALCGECVFHWVCKSREKKDETEGSRNERASNYMTDLASGSLWLNRAPFPDITPQSFHNILPLSLMPIIFTSTACESFAAVCVYVCVCSATLAPPGLPILGHASRSGPQPSLGCLPGLY